MQIRKAERKKAKLRLAIAGPSGSGKTWSALEIAIGMGGKIGMIDTESGSGELYAEDFSKYYKDKQFNYDVIRIDPPYSPERYIEALKTFEMKGYDIVIIDSLSHAWAGEGGVLSIVDRAGGQFQNGWKTGTPKQNALVDSLINSKVHVICTLRVKTDYIIEKNDKGKNVPRKVGLAPIQRDQLEYEFTIFMNIDGEHIAHVTKDRTRIFNNEEFIKPSPSVGEKLMEWLNTGVDQKEYFNNVIIKQIITELNECNDLNSLREKFTNFYNMYHGEYPEMMDTLISVKDKRKEEIMTKNMENIPAPPIKTSSPYPNILNQNTGGYA